MSQPWEKSYSMHSLILVTTAAECLKRKGHIKEEEKQQHKKPRTSKIVPNPFLMKREEMGQKPRLETFTDNDFQSYTRMDRKTFQILLQLIFPKPHNRRFCRTISPEEKLSLTLRYLASGNSFADLKFLTAISPVTIAKIVIETCEKIITNLKEYIKLPETSTDWKRESDQFNARWNFPHCIGAIDGKHIGITKPVKDSDLYLNYKNTHSIVLMAVVNAKYEFLMVDVGANGRAGDAGVLKKTKFYSKLVNKELDIPEPECLPNSTVKAPFVFVGDSAFALNENLLKPYSFSTLDPQEITFNYRVSRARAIVENTFGILANRFRVLHTNINLSPEKVTKITLACCYLHNFIKRQRPNEDEKHTLIMKNNTLTSNSELEENSSGKSDFRNIFKQYFNGIGALPP